MIEIVCGNLNVLNVKVFAMTLMIQLLKRVRVLVRLVYIKKLIKGRL